MMDGLMIIGAFIIASVAIIVALIYPSKGSCTVRMDDRVKDEGVTQLIDKKEMK